MALALLTGMVKAAGSTPTQAEIQQAFDYYRWGAVDKGGGAYGKAVMDCADALAKGDFDAAKKIVNDYHKNAPNP